VSCVLLAGASDRVGHAGSLLAGVSGGSLLEGTSGFVAMLLLGQRVLPVPPVCLVGQSLFLRCSCLLTLLPRERHARAAVLLVLQTCKSGLPLLSPRSLAGKPDVEAAAAKPQEDGAGGRLFSCLGSAFGRPMVLGDAPGKEAFGEK
jgi:hypothetical protein